MSQQINEILFKPIFSNLLASGKAVFEGFVLHLLEEKLFLKLLVLRTIFVHIAFKKEKKWFFF